MAVTCTALVYARPRSFHGDPQCEDHDPRTGDLETRDPATRDPKTCDPKGRQEPGKRESTEQPP